MSESPAQPRPANLRPLHAYRSVREWAAPERIDVTPLRRADHASVVAMLGRCSAATLQRRFHGFTDGAAYAARLHTEATGEIGYGAWVAGRCVGLASLHADNEASAEIGVLVEDDWQGRRVGSALVSALVGHARQRGLSTLRAEVQADNEFILAALTRVGPTRTSMSFGVYTVTVDLERPGADLKGVA